MRAKTAIKAKTFMQKTYQVITGKQYLSSGE